MLTAIIGSAPVTILVLILSIVTIHKGYGYKHKIDPDAPHEGGRVQESE